MKVLGSNERGMTLVQVLVVGLILSAATLAISNSLTNQMRSQVNARQLFARENLAVALRRTFSNPTALKMSVDKDLANVGALKLCYNGGGTATECASVTEANKKPLYIYDNSGTKIIGGKWSATPSLNYPKKYKFGGEDCPPGSTLLKDCPIYVYTYYSVKCTDNVPDALTCAEAKSVTLHYEVRYIRSDAEKWRNPFGFNSSEVKPIVGSITLDGRVLSGVNVAATCASGFAQGLSADGQQLICKP